MYLIAAGAFAGRVHLSADTNGYYCENRPSATNGPVVFCGAGQTSSASRYDVLYVDTNRVVLRSVLNFKVCQRSATGETDVTLATGILVRLAMRYLKYLAEAPTGMG